jgi:hypothetical protein
MATDRRSYHEAHLAQNRMSTRLNPIYEPDTLATAEAAVPLWIFLGCGGEIGPPAYPVAAVVASVNDHRVAVRRSVSQPKTTRGRTR